jgi:hypothetical protein
MNVKGIYIANASWMNRVWISALVLMVSETSCSGIRQVVCVYPRVLDLLLSELI